ncbi:hypothetical protein Tco_1005683 [Tanacetum coccineum]|uniref:Uncharacterized protein n=1 Tax=Tanacetum coccineum TaxID=301880 RepID=A0ABQ5FFP8_9ASTR
MVIASSTLGREKYQLGSSRSPLLSPRIARIVKTLSFDIHKEVGYQQKGQKTSQNGQNWSMEWKAVQNQGLESKMTKSESLSEDSRVINGAGGNWKNYY